MIVTKATAAVETVESENPNGQFDVILSTKALDRDGDELNADEWKQPLPDHITFDSDHGMSVATTVGSGRPFINDAGQLQVRGTFASTPHAQNVRTLVNEGHIKTTSVAFIQSKNKKDAKAQRELLNGAFVAVPANPEALVLSSKAAVLQMVKAAADAPANEAPATPTSAPAHDDMVQAVHDASVHLGAVCATGEAAAQIGEADGANKSFAFKAADADDDPAAMVASIDAVLDEACKLVAGIDRQSLPPEVVQCLDLLNAAESAVDDLMDVLGIYDPDDDDTDESKSHSSSRTKAGTPEESPDRAPADAATKAAATAPAKVPADAADLSADPMALRARALAFLLKANT